MKTILSLAAILFLLYGCSNTEVNKVKMLQSWEVNTHTGDTINRMDDSGKKQGLWIENKTDTVIYKDGLAI